MVDAIDTNVRTLTVQTFSMWEAFETLEHEVQQLRDDLNTNTSILQRIGRKLGIHMPPRSGSESGSQERSNSGYDVRPDDTSFNFSPLPDYQPSSLEQSPAPARDDEGSAEHLVAVAAPDGEEAHEAWPPPLSQLRRGPPIMSRARIFGAVNSTGSVSAREPDLHPTAPEPSSSATALTGDVEAPATSPVLRSIPASRQSPSTAPFPPVQAEAGQSSATRATHTSAKVSLSICSFPPGTNRLPSSKYDPKPAAGRGGHGRTDTCKGRSTEVEGGWLSPPPAAVPSTVVIPRRLPRSSRLLLV